MKKLLSLLLIICSFFAFFTGCSQKDESMAIGKDINKNLNKLGSIVTKLDTIDTNYIQNPDFVSGSNTNKNINTYVLAFNEDENALDTVNTQISAVEGLDTSVNLINETSNIEYVSDNQSPEIIIDNTTQNETVLDERENNNSNTKFYFYTRESFEPIKLKYKPRYVNQYNETDINEQIVNYLYKVQKLYAMTEDAIEANNILNNCKFTLLESVNDVKSLNECIMDGSCKPSIQQIQALQNYLLDIKNTIKNFKDCNGDLTDEVNNISGNPPTSIATSVDVINSNYMRLINHLDTRISYHESAIATLEQMKYLLNEATGSNEITEEEIVEIIDELSPTENNDILDNDVIDDTNNTDILTDTPIDNEEISDIELSENEVNDFASNEDANTSINNTETTIADTESGSEIQTDDAEDEIIDDVIDNNLIDSEAVDLNDNNTIDDDIIDNQDNETLNEQEEYILENNNVEKVEDKIDETEQATNKNSFSNIDTYMNETFPSNIDDNKTTDNLDNEVNNAENNNEVVNKQNNEVMSDNINNAITPNEQLDNDNLDNNANEGVNNNGYADYENSVGFTNGIITQNNLNNNNGYGGYYYGEDGQIYNNGFNNAEGEIGNNGNTIENNLNSNNNVNTYGYNTMLDVINQGTVNNGINTL